LSTTWRPVIAAISIFAMSDPSLTFGTLHQTGTALPSRIFTRNVAGLFDHLVGELLELQGTSRPSPLAVLKLTTSSNFVEPAPAGWPASRP
jgi:hypothetical protein